MSDPSYMAARAKQEADSIREMLAGNGGRKTVIPYSQGDEAFIAAINLHLTLAERSRITWAAHRPNKRADLEEVYRIMREADARRPWWQKLGAWMRRKWEA